MVVVEVVTTAAPVTVVVNPVVGDTVATAVDALDHTPPPVASVKAVVPPLAHRLRVPVIAKGIGFTVNNPVREQPVTPDVNVISDVPDRPIADIVVEVPVVGESVATVPVALYHVPMLVSPTVAVAPEHALMVPVNTGGKGLTVTVCDTVQLPPNE